MNAEQAKRSEDEGGEMVRVYAAASTLEVELVEAAFRAHQLPHVVRYKLGYMEPTFVGDELRTPYVLVHHSRVSDAQALLATLGLADDDAGPSPRDRFEAVLDALGTPDALPLDSLWTVAPEEFADWLVGALPDLFERLAPPTVRSALQELDEPGRHAYRDALDRAVADAPEMTRTAIYDGLADEPAPDPTSVWASLLGR